MPTLAELLQVQWRWPWAVLLVLLPLALGWLARRRRQRLARYADAHLLPWAVQRRAQDRVSRLRRGAELLAWCLLALAMAGPRLPAAVPDEPQAGTQPPHVIDVMVVLDVSASMAATDVAPDRLSRARLALQDLLRRLHGERLGLLVFAGQAGLLLPPTEDSALFAHALQQIDPALLNAPGTDVARALTLAREQLAQGDPAHARAVLLVSDAEEDSLRGAPGEATAQAVAALRTAGMPLFVLVAASEEGATFELPSGSRALRDGAPVLSRPDASAYRRLARSSGGELAWLGEGEAAWRQLYDDGLARLPGAAVPTAQAQAWRELYQWPLGLALLLLFGALLPPAARALPPAGAAGLLLAALLGSGMPVPARATDALPPADAAAQAYRAGQWEQARPLFERQGGYAGQMGAGACAWKLRDYAGAAQHYAQALLLARGAAQRDDALYNLGSAHYGQEHWLAAAQAWRAVLLSRPGDARAAANLAQAELQLARRAGTATRSDLHGRLGFAVEGYVGMDGLVPQREEPLLLPDLAPGARGNGAAGASGARLQAEAQAPDAAAVEVQARQLESGLLKLERVQERPRELLKGLLRQDRQPTVSGGTGAAW